jgi:hypothetical protein
MAKMMLDGERRVIKRIGCDIDQGGLSMDVVAIRIDSETPYVALKHGNQEFVFTDSEASELAARIKKALAILPSSK